MKVQKTLGDNWDQFHVEFVEVSHSLLPQEFDNRWSEFYARYAPRNQNLAKYLDTLRKDRFTWAWPWIRTVFTAGMQSTQRVEKAHHLVKVMMNYSRQASLADVLKTTLTRSDEEYFSALFQDDQEEKKAAGRSKEHLLPSDMTSETFSNLLDAHEKMLEHFLQTRLKREMEWSFGFRIKPTNLEALKQVKIIIAFCCKQSKRSNLFFHFFSDILIYRKTICGKTHWLSRCNELNRTRAPATTES
ncbi:MAG: hypothetical protein BYD32DRAFT_186250 [Podila humilis]|nr:MAG: hypothetical protein BYD32DRAFT_186250 [Podila humilis]